MKNWHRIMSGGSLESLNRFDGVPEPFAQIDSDRLGAFRQDWERY